MSRPALASLAAAALACASAWAGSPRAQAAAPPPHAQAAAPEIADAALTPVAPPRTPLPPESASAAETSFSFIAYGDTRCDCRMPDGDPAGLPETEPAHREVVDAMLAKIGALASTRYPARFVVQSGDATYRGADAPRWPVFRAIVERLTIGANLPFFFVPGNHDAPEGPPGDRSREVGLHNTLTVLSKLLPAEGSPRRLSGYGTFAFGYGNLFVVGFDSNVAEDPTQLAWVRGQLEGLDRGRYRHVVALFHHPAYSSGRYSGVATGATLPNGQTASAAPSPQMLAVRALYMPLFRAHHVRLVLTGHDHLFDHWVERYVDDSGPHRLDQIVSGGGGAPTYLYTGEPDLASYAAAAGPAARLRIEHAARPSAALADNPHHFLVVRVDGDRLSVEVVGVRPYAPYNGRTSLDLER
ncbi:MAG: metallophosphoesterase [Acidobacteria bacterium]|nr:metallophosphoesterase [Acidobacteriota bacterium]